MQEGYTEIQRMKEVSFICYVILLLCVLFLDLVLLGTAFVQVNVC